MHCWLGAQTAPQAPQLFWSAEVSVHWPLQHENPLHELPQAPQLLGSLFVFTHWAPHIS
jgi:hypothetical protein